MLSRWGRREPPALSIDKMTTQSRQLQTGGLGAAVAMATEGSFLRISSPALPETVLGDGFSTEFNCRGGVTI